MSHFGGHIEIDNTPSRGVIVKVYLSRAAEEAQPPRIADDSGYLPPGNETVLLVDDEPSVRRLASAVLTGQGYHVLKAANGHEAVRMGRECAEGELDLLLTDVVMPLMDGKQLAEQLRKLHPTVNVLFTSGYADDSIARYGVSGKDADFMKKPFEVATLARMVREVLDKP